MPKRCRAAARPAPSIRPALPLRPDRRFPALQSHRRAAHHPLHRLQPRRARVPDERSGEGRPAERAPAAQDRGPHARSWQADTRPARPAPARCLSPTASPPARWRKPCSTARQRGQAVSTLTLQTLWPVPETPIGALCGRAAEAMISRVVVAELNLGEFRREIERVVYRRAGRSPPRRAGDRGHQPGGRRTDHARPVPGR